MWGKEPKAPGWHVILGGDSLSRNFALHDLWAEQLRHDPGVVAFLRLREEYAVHAFREPADVDVVEAINTCGFLPSGVKVVTRRCGGFDIQLGEGQSFFPAGDDCGDHRAVLFFVGALRYLGGDTKRQGTVYIEEVDACLSPAWQHRLGPNLKRIFPGCTFIVTTQSPIICQAVDSVLVLPTPGSEEGPRMASEHELNRLRYGDVLTAYGTQLFGPSDFTRSVEGREKMSRLARLNCDELERGLSPEEESEQEKLREQLGSIGSFGM